MNAETAIKRLSEADSDADRAELAPRGAACRRDAQGRSGAAEGRVDAHGARRARTAGASVPTVSRWSHANGIKRASAAVDEQQQSGSSPIFRGC